MKGESKPSSSFLEGIVEQDRASFETAVHDVSSMLPDNQPPDTHVSFFFWNPINEALEAVKLIGNGNLWDAASQIPRNALLSITEKEPMVYRDLEKSDWPKKLKHEANRLGVKSQIAVPLFHDTEPLGAINFFYTFVIASKHISGMRSSCRLLGFAIQELFLKAKLLEIEKVIGAILRHDVPHIFSDVELLVSEELASAPLAADTRKILQNALLLCEHGRSLMSDIEIGREVKLGQSLLFSKPLDLRRVIDNSIDMLNAGGIQIDVEFPDGEHIVHGDEVLLERVIVNIMLNAIAHSKPNTPISIAFSDLDDAWKLTVTNEGPVVPNDWKERIFDEYSQAPGSSDKDSPLRSGSGLGLYIVRYIVEANGGRVWEETPSEFPGCSIIIEIPK